MKAMFSQIGAKVDGLLENVSLLVTFFEPRRADVIKKIEEISGRTYMGYKISIKEKYPTEGFGAFEVHFDSISFEYLVDVRKEFNELA